MYTLKAEYGKKFVEALRSKRYKQAQGVYKSGEDCYCAMGLFALVNGIPIKSEVLLGNTDDFIESSLECEIVDRNDDHDNTFEDIADWIEEEVEFI